MRTDFSGSGAIDKGGSFDSQAFHGEAKNSLGSFDLQETDGIRKMGNARRILRVLGAHCSDIVAPVSANSTALGLRLASSDDHGLRAEPVR